MLEELRRKIRVGAARLTDMMLGIDYVEVRVDGEIRRVLRAGDRLDFICGCEEDVNITIEVF